MSLLRKAPFLIVNLVNCHALEFVVALIHGQLKVQRGHCCDNRGVI